MNAIDHLVDQTQWTYLTLRALGRPDAGSMLADAQAVDARLREREARDPSLPSCRLARAIGATSSERHVIALLAAIAVHPGVRVEMARFGVEPRPDPTLDAIRRVIYGDRPSREALAELGPDGTLQRLDIIERTDAGEAHETRQTWALSRRVLALLHDDNAIDPTLATVARLADDGPALDEVVAHDRSKSLAVTATRGNRVVAMALGARGLGRRTLLVAAARAAGRSVLEIDARELAREPAALRKQLRAIVRELRISTRVPLVTSFDAVAEDLAHLVASALGDGFAMITSTHRPLARWRHPTVAIEMGAPTAPQRARLWQRALDATPNDGAHLANLYPFGPATIRQVAAAALARAPDRGLTPEDIAGAVRATLDDRFAAYAHRIEVTQTWDDLVLPDDQRRAIGELVGRVRERQRVYDDWGFGDKLGRGLGIAALLSGPPGTGKTMVAGLVARDLGLELYQVDAARITSKWIGETEKQLATVFDAAEAGHAILLFDEADSLFGKRTEVRSSNDRHANLETNYLLQRLESFTGVCILTTNHETAIDPAFQRRLAIHVRFALPGVEERVRLWHAMLPEAAPVVDFDATRLAERYPISGGYIRNAVLRAAFLAAGSRRSIDATLLEHAARLECEAMGKIAA